MKKISIIITLMFISIVSIKAQTIHWITFIDTKDESVGEVDKNTRKILYSHWINVVNAALAEKGYNSDIQDYYGDRNSPENMKDVVKKLKSRPDDIIVFYYVGHGGRSINDKSDYPQMCVGQHDQNKFIPLEWVNQELKKKNSRFTLTIGMCCNSYSEGIKPKMQPTFSLNYGATYLSDNEISGIQNLFLKNKGNILVSSSKKGQTSGACSSELGDTDFFTYILLKLFQYDIKQKSNPDWTGLLKEVALGVNEVTQGEQTPQYIVNINASSQPQQKEQQRPNTHQDEEITIEEVLIQCLDYIVDKSIAEKKRIELADRMIEELFSPNAIVKIVGQDGDMVIDKETATDYISNISSVSSSGQLLKVALAGGEIGKDGKIEILKVKEYYKK